MKDLESTIYGKHEHDENWDGSCTNIMLISRGKRTEKRREWEGKRREERQSKEKEEEMTEGRSEKGKERKEEGIP